MRTQQMVMGMLIAAISGCSERAVEKDESVLETRLIRLDADGEDYKNILREGITSHVLHSGLVILGLNESVGEHNSKQYEEIIIPLSGEGQMISPDGTVFEVTQENAIYCPPWTTHNVKNTGDTPLKYVYVVSKTNVKPESAAE